jgi:hypothetical protein
MLNFKNYILTVVILLFCYPAVVQAQPANDDCGNAISISDGDTSFDSTGATPDGPADCGSIGNDIWYTYTATCDGTLYVNTCGSGFDTTLVLYDGPACSSLSVLSCSDDSDTCGFLSLQSAVVGPVVSGQQYLVRVGGYEGATGSGTLSLTCKPDECTNPTALDVPSLTLGSTTGENIPGVASCGASNSTTSPGVWYTVTGTGNMMTASTCYPTTDFDTQLAVYCNGCDTLTCVDGNDDDADCGPDEVLSTVTWCSESDATYQILVHGYAANSGNFRLGISDDGVSCTTGPQCAPIGACCSADVCSLVTADNCAAQSGVYQGDGTTCQDVTCGGPGAGAEGEGFAASGSCTSIAGAAPVQLGTAMANMLIPLVPALAIGFGAIRRRKKKGQK